jgi:flagellar biogenesis protein FliO
MLKNSIICVKLLQEFPSPSQIPQASQTLPAASQDAQQTLQKFLLEKDNL